MRPSYALISTILWNLMMLHVYEAQKIYSMSIDSLVTCSLSNLANPFVGRVEGLLYVQPSEYLNISISWIGYINCNDSVDTIRDIFSAQNNKAMAVVLYPIHDNLCDIYLPDNISVPVFFEVDSECKTFIFNNRFDQPPDALIKAIFDENYYNDRLKSKVIIIICIVIAVISGQIILCFLKARIWSSSVNNESSDVRNDQNNRSKGNGITNTLLDSFPVYLFPQIEDDISNDLEKGNYKELTEESNQSHNIGRTHIGGNDIMMDDEIIEIHSDHSKIMDKQLTCPICLGDFLPGEELRILPCNHQYHRVCIDPWLLDISSLCPVCKADCISKNAELPVSARDDPSNENPNNTSSQITVNFQETTLCAEGRHLGDGDESSS
ncbi:12873_t:CDS:2 [Acaulospora morrowiae]|uniref:12873_t:CDS:1 n=1 Tax=Acaulospora morrowiae TaxID=94023 RepID=A0A9N9H562_9GLOM|nr:12873_t:CDS:2 [Acaulospora morrowiae]